jgi:hypothetical protein
LRNESDPIENKKVVFLFLFIFFSFLLLLVWLGWSDHWLALALQTLLFGENQLLTRRILFMMQTFQIIVSNRCIEKNEKKKKKKRKINNNKSMQFKCAHRDIRLTSPNQLHSAHMRSMLRSIGSRRPAHSCPKPSLDKKFKLENQVFSKKIKYNQPRTKNQ